MQGILRIIPNTQSRKSHQVLFLSRPPSLFMIEAAVGSSEIAIVEGFNTVLHAGEAVPCIVYCAAPREFYEDSFEASANLFANLLWFQARLRNEMLARAVYPSSIHGPVAVLFGDRDFMGALRSVAFEPKRKWQEVSQA